MKKELQNIVKNSIDRLFKAERSIDLNIDIEISIPKHTEYGDYSSNIAMILANKLKTKPRDIAEKISSDIKANNSDCINNVEIAGPGFINFFLNRETIINKISQINSLGSKYGNSNLGAGRKIIVEFVSANPTGYLHLGHARNAVVGDVVSRLLKAVGYDVTNEYYINDAGRQIDMLGISVFRKYERLFGRENDIPVDGYNGDYIDLLAQEIKENLGNSLIVSDNGELEGINYCKEYSQKRLLDEIKVDLEKAGIKFDNWFSEYDELHTDNNSINIMSTKSILNNQNTIEYKDNAVWFKATDFGENQDWVLIKSDGSPTYFLADIAYHYNKIQRDYNKLINIWGADHHSHISRLKSAIKALGYDDSMLQVLIIQFVRLISNGKEVSMSKRSGDYITMREVIDEVGSDVLRFFMLMRSTDSHLDFDLDLAKKESSENPVFYIQYAYARINSIFEKAATCNIKLSGKKLALLERSDELELAKTILNFPEIISDCAETLAPHKVTFYLQQLASKFHIYYNNCRIISDNKELSRARLFLIHCIQIVLHNGLKLLGVSTPQRM